MKILNMIRMPTTFLMIFLLTDIPAFALSKIDLTDQINNTMLSTSSVVADLSRAQAEANVRDYLEKDVVQDELIKQGISPSETSKRLASLSDTELRQLSMQVEQARYGGDVLFTVLIIVLIIYLMKRI